MTKLRIVLYWIILVALIAIGGFISLNIPFDLGNECVNWIFKILCCIETEVIIGILVLLVAGFIERWEED